MRKGVGQNWLHALGDYRYLVNLSQCPGQPAPWPPPNLGEGDRHSTIQFEDYFRHNAKTHSGVWIQVVYWKLYSQAARRNVQTMKVAHHLNTHHVQPEALWTACSAYINNPTKDSLRVIIEMLGHKSKGNGARIAVAATFPAFLDPDSFPMVDQRIAKWVGHSMKDHNARDAGGPQLSAPNFLEAGRTTLALADFEFVEHWYRWCRHTARKLSRVTGSAWRARDVEMAVFYAWGNRNEQHPKLLLEALGPI